MKVIEKLKEIFSFSSSLIFEASAQLADGKEIRIEGDLESGSKIFLITDEGEIPMPVGEWVLSDGVKILIEEEGVIEEITEPTPDEETEPPVVEQPEEVVEEAVEETTEEDEPQEQPQEEPEETPDLKGLEQRVSALEELLTKLLDEQSAFQSEYTAFKDDFSKAQEEFSSFKTDYSKTQTEIEAKFERTTIVAPVKQNEDIPVNKTSSPYLGSYEDMKREREEKKENLLGSYEDLKR